MLIHGNIHGFFGQKTLSWAVFGDRRFGHDKHVPLEKKHGDLNQFANREK